MENQNESLQTSSQPTSPQPSNLPSQPLPKNKPQSSFLTNKLFLITLVLLFLFAIVYSGIYISLNSRMNQITKANPTSTIVLQPSLTPNKTANWKTYRNDEFGFEVKYPSGWFAYDDRNFPCEYALFSRKQISDCRFADYIPADFYVFKTDLYNPFPKSLPNQIYTPFILDGEKGVINFATEQSDGPRAKNTTILVNHNGYGYMITFLNIDYQGNHEQVFDQILSTFKFTNQYTELNGKVWVDVNQITTAINLYYAETKRLPKSLEELTSLPSLSFFTLNKNPITGKPYVYTPYGDGKSFLVSGTQSDGTEYTKEVSTK